MKGESIEIIKNMKQDLKVGDLVTIIPHDDHNKSVKENYGKVLKIKQVVKASNCLLYKVGGIPKYALREDLKQLAKERNKK